LQLSIVLGTFRAGGLAKQSFGKNAQIAQQIVENQQLREQQRANDEGHE
jgi:hypothetical protein